MNYLMHIYFCTNDPESLAGACLGDFFKGKIAALPYSEKIRQGIQLHRTLDLFADQHPVILQAKTLFPKGSRRMAGIALDIFYDHFLAKQWTQYSPLPLAQYTQNFYHGTATIAKELPSEARQLLKLIITGDWLTSYREEHTIEFVLKRMGQYLPFPNTLDQTYKILQENHPELQKNFTIFMTEARTKLTCNYGLIN